ncbi:MAG: hypothetical protein NVS4B11_13310 [Ktedonobacteraceae bacterium]
MTIRLGARAVIVRNNQLLLVKCNDADVGVHYNLPGGGVEDNELLEDAVRREVLEETCTRVGVGRVLFVFEYIPTHHRYQQGVRHSVQVIFECKLQEHSEARIPDIPDTHQIGVVWVPLSNLSHILLLPQIREQLIAALNDDKHYPFVLRETL